MKGCNNTLRPFFVQYGQKEGDITNVTPPITTMKVLWPETKLFFFLHKVSQVTPDTIQQFNGNLRVKVADGASSAVQVLDHLGYNPYSVDCIATTYTRVGWYSVPPNRCLSLCYFFHSFSSFLFNLTLYRQNYFFVHFLRFLSLS